MNVAPGNSHETLKWYDEILTIATLPIAPAIVAYAGLASYTENYLSQPRVRLRMQQCGRYLSRSDAGLRIKKEGGTLIIENPTVSWDFTHAW
ncbi:MAG: hypothetical protein MUC83_02790 [Pirellula sp.]|jgi:hypothetical protein|nr:hypothetical protein [Pirellula sp.]